MAGLNPATVIGDPEPVPVNPPGEEVTVYDVAAGESPGKENETDAAALENALFVPTSVATTLTGAFGSRKSFCCKDFDPNSFFAIYISPIYLFIFYAVRSPTTTHESVPRFKSVADDHCVRSFNPGVAFTVTPAAPAIVTCPAPV